jgi:hypothetical protein
MIRGAWKKMFNRLCASYDPADPAATRPATRVELIAAVALALSTLVAATAVSIGIARADVFGTHADSDTAPFAIALFIGLLLAAMGGLTALMAAEPLPRE